MTTENILNRLDKVRKTSGHSWIACCPAHGDKSPSLAIKEIEDGRTLLHCFAGCNADEVLGAIGLALSDLYPETLGERCKPVKRPWIAQDVLRCLALEALVILQCARVLKSGAALTTSDQERLVLSVSRFQAGERVCHA